MKDLYYRCYVITFKTSKCDKLFYVGKHVSSYVNSCDDPYRGSGNIIRRAYAKYKEDCIINIQWFDCCCDTINDMEISMIAEYKNMYGELCVNIAQGGNGSMWHYATPEQRKQWAMNNKLAQRRPEVNARRSASLKKTYATPEMKAKKKLINDDPKLKQLRSDIQRVVQKKPEVNAKRSESLKKALADPTVKKKMSESSLRTNADPVVKKKISDGIKRAFSDPQINLPRIEAIKKAHRKAPVWKLYDELYDLWLKSGKFKAQRFSTWLKNNTEHVFTCDQLGAMVSDFFKKDQM